MVPAYMCWGFDFGGGCCGGEVGVNYEILVADTCGYSVFECLS